MGAPGLRRDAVRVRGGPRLPSWQGGSGRDALVVHGGPDFGSTYLHRPLLDAAGDLLRFVFYDQRGTGRAPRGESDPPSPGGALERLVQDLEQVRRHYGLAAPILVGHSFGGIVCLEYARRFASEVSGLLLVDPDPLVRADWEAGRVAARERRSREDAEWLATHDRRATGLDAYYRVALRSCFEDAAKADGLELSLHHDPADRPCSVGREVRSELGEWDLRPALVGLGIPALVVAGERSIFPRSAHAAYVETLPDCRLAVVGGAGHFPHMEAPALFRAEVAAFLAGLP